MVDGGREDAPNADADGPLRFRIESLTSPSVDRVGMARRPDYSRKNTRHPTYQYTGNP